MHRMEKNKTHIFLEYKPVSEITGKIIAVIRRINDIEEKWVVAPEYAFFSKEEIAEQVKFQEQFFEYELLMS